jgi:chemotaxis protein MotB
MKGKILILLLFVIFLAGCGGKNVKEENLKLKSDLEALQKNQVELQAQIKGRDEKINKYQKEREKELSDFRGNFSDEEQNGDISIKMVRGGLSASVADKLFFAPGKAELSPSGKNMLNKIVRVVKQMPDKVLRIDGHTDNAPIRVGSELYRIYPTNWELAAARAVNVVRYLTEKGGVDSSIISASSYSMYHPVLSNDTKTGRAKNRRIEIVLLDKELNNAVKPQEE